MVLLVPSVVLARRGLVSAIVGLRGAEVRDPHAGDLRAEPAEAIANPQETAEPPRLAEVAGAFQHRAALGELVGGGGPFESPQKVDAHVEPAEVVQVGPFFE